EQAALSYRDNPTALHLRAMNMLYEGLKEKGALMLVPSSAVESMGMGGLLGAAALQQQQLARGAGDDGKKVDRGPTLACVVSGFSRTCGRKPWRTSVTATTRHGSSGRSSRCSVRSSPSPAGGAGRRSDARDTPLPQDSFYCLLITS